MSIGAHSIPSIDIHRLVSVDRHQCEPPKLMELSASKSPSRSFILYDSIDVHRLQLQRYHHLVQELQPSDMMHYADEPPGRACLHSHPSLGSVSQPCLADGCRSMFGLKCLLAVAHKCQCTDEEHRSTFAEKCR
ncbi:hypothetical protein F2Q70_00003622 [Brassica cretica]|uniref:Uncharacterized protein n=1 Tax=Brassica cretica TaxID=69181 RepID=A0A8S9IL30_BRACR|nr:hypothetical protein F2Q68_00021013 [Brassica cretica]KAF2570598.1 hypothetical protein F2Q70_00003622 [Brassica cretica]